MTVRPLIVIALGAACWTLAAACTTTTATPRSVASDPGTSPAERGYKEERFAIALEGLEFLEDRVMVDALPHDPIAAARRRPAATTLARQGYHIESMAAWAESVRLAPEVPDGYLGLAELLQLEGHGDEALAACRTALAVDPDHVPSRFRLAMLRWQRGEADIARARMEQVVRMDPDNGPAHLQLAIWNHYAGNHAAAQRHARACELLGEPIPPQFERMLRARN